MDLITLKDAAFGYEGRAVVRNVNLAVEQGSYLAIVGENGSGKSTLVKGLLRFIKPLTGSVTYAPGFTKKSIGYLSQSSPVKNDFPAGAGEIALSGFVGQMGLRPFYTRAEKEKSQANMARLGVANLSKKCFSELSGGQQRRVLIARALNAIGGAYTREESSRAILVLDEPAASLDAAGQEDLYALLRTLNKDDGITVIMISHDTEAVKKYASKMIMLKGGIVLC
jgi:zinc transport system ATP-binding protein